MQKLESFLKETKCGNDAIDEEKCNGALSTKTRQKIVGLVCDFIGELFGPDADPKLIKMTCGEVIEIFPSLKFDPSDIGGIVSNVFEKYEDKYWSDSVFYFLICQDLLYNSGKSSGFIFNTLAYRKKKAKSVIVLEDNNNADIAQALEACSINEEGKEIPEDDINNILAYFKSCLVSEEQPELIEKMRETETIRSNILLSDNHDLQETFPFYFSCPKLVSMITDLKLVVKILNIHSSCL